MRKQCRNCSHCAAFDNIWLFLQSRETGTSNKTFLIKLRLFIYPYFHQYNETSRRHIISLLLKRYIMKWSLLTSVVKTTLQVLGTCFTSDVLQHCYSRWMNLMMVWAELQTASKWLYFAFFFPVIMILLMKIRIPTQAQATAVNSSYCQTCIYK